MVPTAPWRVSTANDQDDTLMQSCKTKPWNLISLHCITYRIDGYNYKWQKYCSKKMRQEMNKLYYFFLYGLLWQKITTTKFTRVLLQILPFLKTLLTNNHVHILPLCSPSGHCIPFFILLFCFVVDYNNTYNAIETGWFFTFISSSWSLFYRLRTSFPTTMCSCLHSFLYSATIIIFPFVFMQQ